MQAPIARVRLQQKVFDEFREEWPFLEKNEFELIRWESGRWAWLVTIRYPHPVIDWRFQLEDEELDETSKSVVVAILGPHDAWLKKFQATLEARNEIRRIASKTVTVEKPLRSKK